MANTKLVRYDQTPGLGLGGYDEYDVRVGMHYAIRARGGAGEADKLSSANGVR